MTPTEEVGDVRFFLTSLGQPLPATEDECVLSPSSNLKRVAVAAFVAVLTGLLPTWRATPVEAAYPGMNGKIIMDVTPNYHGDNPVQRSEVDPNCDLWTVEPDGSDLTNVTTAPGCDWNGSWSPDGTKIAFDSNRAGDFDIYVMDADGGNVRRLTRWASEENYPVWSPNGRRIAFLSDRSRGTDIVVMRADGSNKRLVGSVPGNAWETSWSPRGPRILFTFERSHRNHYDTNDDEDIYVANVRTGRIRPLLATPKSEFTPAWAPDGTRIAFAAAWCTGCSGDIFVADADGSDAVQLTDSIETFDWNPAWSPDGRWIVFGSDEGDPTYTNWDLFVIDPQGENLRRLLLKPDSWDAAPDWQPLP